MKATSSADFAGVDRGPELVRDPGAVALAISQSLGVHERVDRLGQERPRRPEILERTPSEHRQYRLDPIHGSGSRLVGGMRIAHSSPVHTARNTSRNSSAFEAKCR